MKRIIYFLLLMFVVALIPLYVRAILEARNQLTMARVANEEGRFKDAFDAYRSAVSWYAPFNGYSEQAFTEFSKIAFNDLTDTSLKLEAITELKRGIFSSRNFLMFFTQSERLNIVKKIDDELEKLNSTSERKETIEEIYPPKVNFGFQMFSQLMFWSWIVSMFFCIFKGFTPEAKIIRKPLLRGGTFAFLFYFLWLVALRFA